MIEAPDIAIDVHGLTKKFGERTVVLEGGRVISQTGTPRPQAPA